MIKVFNSTAQLSRAAAEIFVQTAQEAVQENGRFTVALTGGSSPEQLYKLLAQPLYRDMVPWEHTFIFWGDERWVKLTDDRSNAKMAFETLLHHVPISKSHIFPMWGEESPEDFALIYEKRLLNHFGGATPQFDLILLGMGDDGHTASLFPGTSVLQETERCVQAYYLEPQSMYRITLTAPCLTQAKKIVFMTYGEKKAKALYEVLEGEQNPTQYPSQLVQPVHGETIWLVDEAAASKLSQKG
ncbi:6-phosphogluconolactonase [Rufibacter tibetensis]|uniref:6-phosphogluconolactonase n=1 Tax=Rufibacter tibetensis TaxID=512763 RepID=A0A0P0CKT1_9BACT|nr:6-phosphogluconolactonase [Rufibacter tibetensis]ALJ00163.1 6-phosphogluconolactonase [Rufibacter tibetensis]